MNWLDDLAEATGNNVPTKKDEPKAKETDIIVKAKDVTPKGRVEMSHYHEDEGVRKLPPQETTCYPVRSTQGQAIEVKARCTVAGTFSVKSKKTNRNIKYKLNTKPGTDTRGPTTFVSLCEGGKPEYLGILLHYREKFSLRQTQGSKREEDHISVIAYKWLLDTFNQEPERMAHRLRQCEVS